MLSKKYNIFLICDPPERGNASSCIRSRRNDDQTLAYKIILNGLYYVKPGYEWKHRRLKSSHSIDPNARTFSIVTYSSNSPEYLHNKLSHIIPETLFEASKLYCSVPAFTMQILKKIFCSDFIVENIKKSAYLPKQPKDSSMSRACAHGCAWTKQNAFHSCKILHIELHWWKFYNVLVAFSR